jgi:ABC-type multidrug transport system ATPase subunit
MSGFAGDAVANPVIQLRQVSKNFGAHQVLKNVDLSVPENSVFAFLGNNGAGKSTTIGLITGLLQCDHGEIMVLGKNIRHHKMAILQQIGCIVDSPSLYPNLTAPQFLRIACLVKRLPSAEIGRVLNLVDLQRTGNTLVGNFSLGMKQRLALAHALLGKPKLLILDEPTNGLDPQGIHQIRTLLQNLAASAQCSIFISSHQLDEVEKIATHLALLKEGSIYCQIAVPEWLSTQKGVLALEVGDAEQARHFLHSLDYDARIVDTGHVEVHQIAPQHADQLHARLIGHGVRLFQSAYQKPSLEQWFLHTTDSKREL